MRFGHCYGHTKDHFTHVRKTTVVGFGFSYPLGLAVAVVTAQSHSRANGIARAAYACSGAVHCGLVFGLYNRMLCSSSL